jgi:phosphate transport system protein
MATRINFTHKLDELQRLIVELGTKTSKTIEDSILAFIDKNIDVSQRIVDEDPSINRMEGDLYNYSALLIAEQQPVARDLRIILNAIRSGHVLERIADSAVHIAKSTIILHEKGYVKPVVDIPKMAKIVLGMLKEAIDAYSSYDTDQAQSIAARDKEVDDIYAMIFKELITYMHEDPSKIEQCMTLLFICRRLERIADQTTHLCEGIIYVSKGENVDLNR